MISRSTSEEVEAERVPLVHEEGIVWVSEAWGESGLINCKGEARVVVN